MEISRRGLLKASLLQTGLMALPLTSNASGKDIKLASLRSGPSILQGATDETSTQFSILYRAGTSLEVEAVDEQGHVNRPVHCELIHSLGQDTALTRVGFTGLRLGQTYQMKVYNAINHELVDEREFAMLDTAKASIKMALCSCMDDRRHSPEIWQDLVAQQPDVILFIGDSVYVDKGEGPEDGPARLWRRFAEARRTLEIYYSKRLIPILATWDDHDFGLNDTGKQYRHSGSSMTNFLRFYAQDPMFCRVLNRGPGVSSSVILGGTQILLLDDRTYRESGDSDDRFAHWGQEQEEWMLERIQSFEGPTWLMNGSQVFPQMMFKQSVSGQHEVQFLAVMDAIRRSGRKVLFASGDVHFSEISRIESSVLGYESFELTSSSIHSATLPNITDIIHNHRRIASTEERNYLLVEVARVSSGCEFSVASRSAGGVVNFQMNLIV